MNQLPFDELWTFFHSTLNTKKGLNNKFVESTVGKKSKPFKTPNYKSLSTFIISYSFHLEGKINVRDDNAVLGSKNMHARIFAKAIAVHLDDEVPFHNILIIKKIIFNNKNERNKIHFSLRVRLIEVSSE